MNEIAVFENAQFGEIRTVTVDGEPWFVAADVCRALELGDTHKAVGRLDDDEKGRNSIPTLGGNQEMAMVNESGLLNLVLGSRKSEARQFRRWITHEVIPAIRKTGMYSVKPMSPAELMLAQAKLIVEQEQQIRTLKEEQTTLSAEQASMKTEQASMKTEQIAIRDKVDDLETKFESKLNPTVGMNWYTITGYISLKNFRVSPDDYSSLGKLATKLSREKGYEIGSAPHPVYGRVNTYSVDILDDVFERYRQFKGGLDDNM